MERIAVVIDCVQCLKRRPDIIEGNFPEHVAISGCLYVVLQFLRSLIATIYLCLIAFAQILLATLPITEYSGSTPLEKKKIG